MAEAHPTESSSTRARLKRYAIVTGVVVLLLIVLYRWLPTSTYQGTVQRVYEKVGEYRVEMYTEDGEVRVFTNSEMRFPYLKFNTADLQANLDRAVREGDLVQIGVWGIRSSFLSTFPNIVRFKVLSSGDAVRRGRTDRIVRAVMSELRARQLVPAGDEAELEDALIQVVEEAESPPPLRR